MFDRWENRHPTIGDAKDIREARLDDVRAFYDAHYAPNNAVLALAGDIPLAQAVKLARRYFSSVPSRAVAAEPELSEPPLAKGRRIEFRDPLAKLSRLMIGWRCPERGTRDFWALTLLAETLGGGEESALYRDLVRRSRLAQVTGAWGYAEQRGEGNR